MLVDVGHMLGEAEVVLGVTLVSDEPQQVEPGQKGCWQLDVGLSGLLDVVPSISWIGSCQDGHTSVQSRHYTSLGGKGGGK